MLKQLLAFLDALYQHGKNLFSGLNLLASLGAGAVWAFGLAPGPWIGSLTIGLAFLAVLGAA